MHLIGICVLFVLVLCVPGLFHQNATYDEGVDIYLGLRMWREHNLSLAEDHPPLMRLVNALPLLLSDVQPVVFDRAVVPPMGDPVWRRMTVNYQMAFETLYRRGHQADGVVMAGRVMSLLCAAAAIWGTGLLGRALGGWKLGLWAALLLAGSPIFVANGMIAKEDIGLTAMVVWLLVALLWWRRKPVAARAVGLGVVFGMTLLMKQTAVLVVPAIGWGLAGRRASSWGRALGVVVLTGWLILIAGYGGAVRVPRPLDAELLAGAVPSERLRGLAGTVLKWMPVPDGYVTAALFHLNKRRYQGAADSQGVPGSVRYLLAWVIKTPEGFLILLGLGLYEGARLLRRRRWQCLCLATAGLWAGPLLAATPYLGTRLLLPSLPLLSIVAARPLAASRWGGRRAIAAGCLAAHVLSGMTASSHPIPYGNLLVGGSTGASRWLSGPDLDWGQDLKNLAGYVKRTGADAVAMAYNGTASPEYYGLRYQNLGTTNVACVGHEPVVHGDRPSRELLVVSAGYLMSRRLSAWGFTPWTAPHQPEAVIGHSIFVFDITRNPDLHLRIARRYLGLGLTQEFRRHSRRISVIVPDDPEPHRILARWCEKAGRTDLAREERVAVRRIERRRAIQ